MTILVSTVFNTLVQPSPLPISPETEPELLPPERSKIEPKLLPIVPKNQTQNTTELVFDENIKKEYLFFISLIFTAFAVITVFVIKRLKQ